MESFLQTNNSFKSIVFKELIQLRSEGSELVHQSVWMISGRCRIESCILSFASNEEDAIGGQGTVCKTCSLPAELHSYVVTETYYWLHSFSCMYELHKSASDNKATKMHRSTHLDSFTISYRCISVGQKQVSSTFIFFAGGAVPHKLHLDLVL